MEAMMQYQRSLHQKIQDQPPQQRQEPSRATEKTGLLSLGEAEKMVDSAYPPACCACMPLHRVAVPRLQYWTLQVGIGFVSYASVIFNNAVLPLLLGPGFLDVPVADQGQAVGRITSLAQGAGILGPIPLGVVAHLIGKRRVLIVVVFLLGILLALQPLAAQVPDVGEGLVSLVRAVHAFSTRGILLSVLPLLRSMVPVSSVGRMGGIYQMMVGLGVAASLLIYTRIPLWLSGPGLVDLPTSVILLFIIVGSMVVVVAVAICCCVRDPADKPPASAAAAPSLGCCAKLGDALKQLWRGIRATSVSLVSAYLGMAASRVNGFLIMNLVILRLSQKAQEENAALSQVESMQEATLLVGCAQLTYTVGAAVAGALFGPCCKCLGSAGAATLFYGLGIMGCIGLWAQQQYLEPPLTTISWVLAVCFLCIGDAFVRTAAYAIMSLSAPATLRVPVATILGLIGVISVTALAPPLGAMFDAGGLGPPAFAASLVNGAAALASLLTVGRRVGVMLARRLAKFDPTTDALSTPQYSTARSHQGSRNRTRHASMRMHAGSSAAGREMDLMGAVGAGDGSIAEAVAAGIPVCTVCGRVYPTQQDVLIHFEKRHGITGSSQFGGQQLAIPGQQSAFFEQAGSPDEALPSYAIGRVAPNASNLAMHQCKRCGAGYMLETDLLVHEQLRHRHHNFECQYPGCHQSFKSAYELEAHMHASAHFWLSASDIWLPNEPTFL